MNRSVLPYKLWLSQRWRSIEFLQYTPSWQEVASIAGVIAYGVIVYSLSYRYLPLFVQLKGDGKNVSVD